MKYLKDNSTIIKKLRIPLAADFLIPFSKHTNSVNLKDVIRVTCKGKGN